MTRRLFLLILVLVSMVILPASIKAMEPVVYYQTLALSGSITAVSEILPDPFSAVVNGDPWRLCYTFDPSAQDIDIYNTSAGLYQNAVMDMTLIIGSAMVTGVPGVYGPDELSSLIGVNLTPCSPPYCYADYAVQMGLPEGQEWALVVLYDNMGTPFSTDSLPTELPTPLSDMFPNDRLFYLRPTGSSDNILIGVVDEVMVDLDCDGISNGEDNCPSIFNPDQTDVNGDGYGDACVAPDVVIPSDDVSIGFNPVIGEGTTINVGVVIGDNTQIGDGVTLNKNIQAGDSFKVGNNSTVHQDAIICDHVTLGDNVTVNKGVYIGSNVTIGNWTVIGKESIIGDYDPDCQTPANVTIGQEVVIGQSVEVESCAEIPDHSDIPKESTFEGSCT